MRRMPARWTDPHDGNSSNQKGLHGADPDHWCIVTEITSGDWGIGGQTLTADDVRALARSEPVDRLVRGPSIRAPVAGASALPAATPSSRVVATALGSEERSSNCKAQALGLDLRRTGRGPHERDRAIMTRGAHSERSRYSSVADAIAGSHYRRMSKGVVRRVDLPRFV